MKKIIVIAIFLTFAASMQAQGVRLDSFKECTTSSELAKNGRFKYDWDGDHCSVLILNVKEQGWVFEAGRYGIVDIEYIGDNIYLYIPAHTTSLTVAHKKYGAIQNWRIPESIKPGHFYTLKLYHQAVKQPEPVKVASGRPQVKQIEFCPPQRSAGGSATPPRNDSKHFSHHFVDMYAGLNLYKAEPNYYEVDECYFGLQYTWLEYKAGPYVSMGFSDCGGFSCLAGAAYRITDSSANQLDWQLYGGIGFIDHGIGGEIGTRFAWRSQEVVSKWDFGIGCQFYRDGIMPTVSVGLYIWGIPVCIGLGLFCCVL